MHKEECLECLTSAINNLEATDIDGSSGVAREFWESGPN